MSLGKRFQTDAGKMRDGFWWNVKDAPNEDGTLPGFRMGRLSVANPRYSAMLSELMAEGDDGEKISAEDREARSLTIFLDSVLLGWRNVRLRCVMPDDPMAGPITFVVDETAELEYSPETARALFSDPEWIDLKLEARYEAAKQSNFAKDALDATVKN